MRNTVDALRSLGRHLSLALGADYTILLGPSDGDYDPPSVHVTLLDRTATGPAGRNDHRRQARVQVHLGAAQTPYLAVLEGYRVEGLLIDALQGEAGGIPAPGVPPAGGARTAKGVIPLWDYDGVGPGEVATSRGARDYLRISAVSTQVEPDRDERRFVTVSASLTMAWSQAVGVNQMAPILHGAGATFQP